MDGVEPIRIIAVERTARDPVHGFHFFGPSDFSRLDVPLPVTYIGGLLCEETCLHLVHLTQFRSESGQVYIRQLELLVRTFQLPLSHGSQTGVVKPALDHRDSEGESYGRCQRRRCGDYFHVRRKPVDRLPERDGFDDVSAAAGDDKGSKSQYHPVEWRNASVCSPDQVPQGERDREIGDADDEIGREVRQNQGTVTQIAEPVRQIRCLLDVAASEI